MLREIDAELDDVNLDMLDGDDERGDGVGVRRVERDIESMSEQQKLALLERDAPEFEQLLDEFRASVDELRGRIEPVVERARQGDLPTVNGMSYLDVKYHLLLNYVRILETDLD